MGDMKNDPKDTMNYQNIAVHDLVLGPEPFVEATRTADENPNTVKHRFEPFEGFEVDITIKPPEVDLSPPAHLFALSVMFCPLCGFRFVRPTANVSYATPGHHYQQWFSFYRCSCCGLYFVAYRCHDIGADAHAKDIFLALCELPRSKYGQETFEQNNRNVAQQLGEQMNRHSASLYHFWAEGDSR
jgi:hypothetical protein